MDNLAARALAELRRELAANDTIHGDSDWLQVLIDRHLMEPREAQEYTNVSDDFLRRVVCLDDGGDIYLKSHFDNTDTQSPWYITINRPGDSPTIVHYGQDMGDLLAYLQGAEYGYRERQRQQEDEA